MDNQDVFSYIKSEEERYKTERVPVTDSKDWNMSEHIERCTNVSNGWYHKGKNDGSRPYKDIVTPIINVAFRTEGFDVKDIVPFVNSINDYHKSFLVKKFHPKWARNNQLDTFIDEVVETSVIYDLVLVKDQNGVRPEVVPLQKIAFCNQTDVMASPIALKHQYSIPQLTEMKGKWDEDAIDMLIYQSEQEKAQGNRSDSKVKIPSKNIELYELRGNLPAKWIDETAEPYTYSNQLHVVGFYKDTKGEYNGITLYKGRDKKLADNFKTLVIKPVFGRAMGKSIVETLFDPQVWANYSEQKLKKLLDSAITVFQSSSDEYAGQKLSEVANNTILKHEDGKPITKVDGNVQNFTEFQNYQTRIENDARILGSASDAQLGTNPVSGTPFALQNLVVQQGEGIHEYRQGKIATFFADILYPQLILKYLVKDINSGMNFSEELTLDELSEVAERIATNKIEKKVRDQILTTGKVPMAEEREQMILVAKDAIMKTGQRQFFETVKDEIKDIPVDVFVNIKGKQRYMAQNADKITNIIREVLRSPEAFTQVPGVGKAFNQLLEESGMSPIDFTPIITAAKKQEVQKAPVGEITQEVGGEQL